MCRIRKRISLVKWRRSKKSGESFCNCKQASKLIANQSGCCLKRSETVKYRWKSQSRRCGSSRSLRWRHSVGGRRWVLYGLSQLLYRKSAPSSPRFAEFRAAARKEVGGVKWKLLFSSLAPPKVVVITTWVEREQGRDMEWNLQGKSSRWQGSERRI